jgi:hypothetical protein
MLACVDTTLVSDLLVEAMHGDLRPQAASDLLNRGKASKPDTSKANYNQMHSAGPSTKVGVAANTPLTRDEIASRLAGLGRVVRRGA